MDGGIQDSPVDVYVQPLLMRRRMRMGGGIIS